MSQETSVIERREVRLAGDHSLNECIDVVSVKRFNSLSEGARVLISQKVISCKNCRSVWRQGFKMQ